MKTKWMLLGGALLATAPAAASAGDVNLRPLVVTNLTGELRIEQDLPSACGDVNQATAVTGGRLEMTPAEGYEVPGGRRFDLTRATITFAPFLIRRSCYTHSEVRDYTALAVQLGVAAAPFTATPTGPETFDLSISRDDVVLYEAARVNGGLETGYRRPSEDVTGTLDFQAKTATLRMVIGTKIHIQGGCLPVVGCVVDGDYHGTLTATVAGTLVFPDADGDDVPDRDDNCRLVPNRDQRPVAPVVRPPRDLTVATCAATRIGTGVAIDICDFKDAVLSNDAPGVFAPGTNRITWRGVAEGSAATAVQTVTVVDKMPPEFASVAAEVFLTSCATGKLPRPVAIDDCGGTPAVSSDAAVLPIGRSIVNWTATDLSGNRASIAQTVNVTDKQAPLPLCMHVPFAPGVYRVAARDDCDAPTIRLGSYVLAYGEQIGIRESAVPGVRLVGSTIAGRERIRLFEVGRGEAFITAGDGSGNVGTGYCR